MAGREKIGKADRLTRDEVKGIIAHAAARARITRAGIRLPIGTSAKVFIVVVNNPNRAGETPDILGIYRTGEATMFSWDVAAQKARTAVFFSNRQLAMSSRTVGFLAQRFFPPGLDGRPHGPLFGFQEAVTLRQGPARRFSRQPESSKWDHHLSGRISALSRRLFNWGDRHFRGWRRSGRYHRRQRHHRFPCRAKDPRRSIHLPRRAPSLRQVPARSGEIAGKRREDAPHSKAGCAAISLSREALWSAARPRAAFRTSSGVDRKSLSRKLLSAIALGA